MPTPRKSTAALQASGSFDKNPKRALGRGNDATPASELGPCPAYLDVIEQECWHRVVADCAPGVLKNSDNIMVENFARLQAIVHRGKGTAAIFSQIAGYSDRFAMNPKSRPNVQIPKAAAENEFSKL